MRAIHVWRSRTPDGVRCAYFPNVIKKIIDHKGQLLKPLNFRDIFHNISRYEILRNKKKLFREIRNKYFAKEKFRRPPYMCGRSMSFNDTV
jgi:hypothetical protein